MSRICCKGLQFSREPTGVLESAIGGATERLTAEMDLRFPRSFQLIDIADGLVVEFGTYS